MRVETVQKTIYSYEDIMYTPELREKVLEKNKNINIDCDAWSDEVTDKYLSTLYDLGFEGNEIHFSGFYSRGDGTCFDCDTFSVDKLVEAVRLSNKEKSLIKKLNDSGYLELSIDKRGASTLYSHENTRQFNCTPEGNYKRINNVVAKFNNLVEALRLETCHAIYKELESMYTTLQEDKAVFETLKADEYEYTEDGCIY